MTRTGKPLPPFMRWYEFMEQWEWKTGEHITTIGPTGSGKTVLNRYLLRRTPIPPRGTGQFVVVLGIKNRDTELYGPFQSDGYQLVRKFDAEPPDDADSAHILFAPLTSRHGDDARSDRHKAFKQALDDIEEVGWWTVYADDIEYMAKKLRLNTEFEEIWMKGRSEGINLVASSQEPVHIPVMAYSAATHLFLFKNPDFHRAQRMAELTGINREVARETIFRLADHEFLYIDKRTGKMLRSMVIR